MAQDCSRMYNTLSNTKQLLCYQSNIVSREGRLTQLTPLRSSPSADIVKSI